MNKKLDFLFWVFLFFFWFAFLYISSGYSFDRKTPVEIPPHSAHHPLFPPKGDAGFCTIQYDNDSVAYYFNLFEAGDGIAVYMDPEDCGSDTNIYPFKISNVHFYLYAYDPGTFVWPVEIKVNIVSVDTTEDTLNPGTIRPGLPLPGRSKTFTIPADSGYDLENPQDPINLTLDEVWCVYSTFFLEIIYTGGTEPPYPSLVITDITDRPDINHNWVLWNGNYVEWCDFWEPWATPGRAVIRVTGYPYAIDCYLCWDWMPKTTQAPNGMPDFDQYQFGSDSVAMCGPTAVANCLVWLDAIPSISDPDSLIQLLSDYFHTDPSADGGTLVDSLEFGLDSLFIDYGLNLYDTTLKKPTSSEILDSLEKSVNIVLLLGLWQKIDDAWCRIGGHYVSIAGACPDSLVALSDPAVDNAETGARGRFLPPHYPHPVDHTLHNTKGFVSHDVYVSDTLSVGPYPESWKLKDYYDGDLPWSQFEGQNFQPEQEQYRHDYDSTKTLYAVVEYAIMILEKSTLVEEEEGETPKYFELHQSFPNPFNNHTTIKYSLSKAIDVSLVIYNILGQKVRTLVRKERQSGLKTVIWDGKDDQGRDLSSGIYFYQLQAGRLTQTRRMVLLK
ncbi:MAG: T9SS type A sorting domain-containing protein [candidate division Zixibacteria bacterium]|nr:T9SS type A sorting domain-containing protein [candidate division Zixibacteria bacterium]